MNYIKVLSMGPDRDFDWCGCSRSLIRNCKPLFTKGRYKPLALVPEGIFRAVDAFIDTMCEKGTNNCKCSYEEAYTIISSFITFTYEYHNGVPISNDDFDTAREWVREYYRINQMQV